MSHGCRVRPEEHKLRHHLLGRTCCRGRVALQRSRQPLLSARPAVLHHSQMNLGGQAAAHLQCSVMMQGGQVQSAMKPTTLGCRTDASSCASCAQRGRARCRILSKTTHGRAVEGSSMPCCLPVGLPPLLLAVWSIPIHTPQAGMLPACPSSPLPPLQSLPQPAAHLAQVGQPGVAQRQPLLGVHVQLGVEQPLDRHGRLAVHCEVHLPPKGGAGGCMPRLWTLHNRATSPPTVPNNACGRWPASQRLAHSFRCRRGPPHRAPGTLTREQAPCPMRSSSCSSSKSISQGSTFTPHSAPAQMQHHRTWQQQPWSLTRKPLLSARVCAQPSQSSVR